MSALGKVVRSGVGRRRLQTFVTGLATMMAVTASVLGGSLLVASTAPFDHAFAGQHGAHLTVQFDAGETTAAQLSASAQATGVTATAGPFATATISPQGPRSDLPGGGGLAPMTVAGRADPGGPVDHVALTSGHWATDPGQIVLSEAYGRLPLGTVLHLPGLPGDPALTVVGSALSVSRSADGWVAPTQIAGLSARGSADGYQMLYRFAAAGSTAQVAADRAAVTAAVPAGALTGAQSWLVTEQGTNRNTALFIPFLIAFGILGVLMSVLIVGNVVAGAVGAGTRRIGILKAIGFTPAQVVRAYMGQALIPAVVGTALGVLAGNALALPVLSQTNQIYGTNTSGVAPWVDLAVIAGALGLVAATAWAAALRAGRLRTVEALAVGRTPRAGRGRTAARLSARLPLPRPLTLGLAHPFARPARTAGMLAAIVFGTVAVTFAIGLGSTLGQVQSAKDHDSADVVIDTFGPPPGAPGAKQSASASASADPAAVLAAIHAQPGTANYYSTATTDVTVAGVSGSSTVFAFGGDASWTGFELVSGTWFHAPGEAVVPTTFLTATGTRVGDSVTLNDHGTAVTVRIVGEVFDPHTQTNEILTDAATLATAQPDLHPTSYHIKAKSGTSIASYLESLNTALQPTGLTARAGQTGGHGGTIVALNSLTALLTLMLVVTAALGVLNSVVLETRERVHDLGVHKALGMTPRQTIAMVIASVVVIGLAGGAIGVPAGVALQSLVVPAMGHSAGITMPAALVNVYHPAQLALLGLGGLLIAVLGAMLPAGWAARTSTATALRTE